jgi:hypothetical protein
MGEAIPATASTKHIITAKGRGGGQRCRACNTLRMRVSRIGSAHALAAVSSWSDEQRRNFYREHSGRDLSPSSLEAKIASSVSKSTRKRSAGASGKRRKGVA